MAGSPLLFLELLLYGAAFICGIVTAALVTVTQGEFGGVCILYSVSQLNASTRSLSIAAPGSASNCAFIKVASILIAVYCFCSAFYVVFACFVKITRCPGCLACCMAISAVFLLLLLACGCLIRVGFSTFCRSVMDQATVKSCSEVEELNWTFPIRGCMFHQNFSIAETATWVNFFLWVVIVCLLLVQQKMGSNGQMSSGDRICTAVSSEVGPLETDFLIPSIFVD